MNRSRKKYQRLVLLMLAVCLIVSLSICVGAADTVPQAAGTVALTEEEKNYIQEHPEIVAAMDTSWTPYCFQSSKSAVVDGILPRLYELIAERTGLKVSFHAEASYKDAIECMESGAAMMVSGIADDEPIAEQYHAVLTDPYIQIYYSAVTKKPTNDIFKTGAAYRVAVCKASYSTVAMQRRMPSYQFLEYESNRECMDAVLRDEVDFALIASHAADYYGGKHQYANLHTVMLDGFSWGLCIGVSENCDPILTDILNKGIGSITTADMNQAISGGLVSASSSVRNLADLIYARPLASIAVAATLVAMLVTILFLIVLRAKTRRENRKLEAALGAARLANQSKTEFLSRISHDMRTPMNGILGMAELSEGENDQQVLKQNIRKIKTSGEYLLGLINDTLDFQRIESGKLQLEPELVNGNEILKGIMDMIRPAMEKKHIDLKVENRNAVLDCYIRVDPVRIKQIFLNLLSNATKFTPEGGMVSVEYECTKREGMISYTQFVIRDTGIGMSEDFLKNRIFKPFSQEYNEVTGKYVGSGLGLSIVKRLVDLMGGSITVESELGAGAAFTITLGFERVTEEEANAFLEGRNRKQKTLRSNLSGKHILLAEDHPLNEEIAERLLVKAGCTVTWAKNGEEAVRLFQDSEPHSIDAVLMDIRMPVMDGLAATEAIRRLDRVDAASIPIIAMTANAYENDVKQCLAAGMNAHLAKPIEPALLYETLAKYVD